MYLLDLICQHDDFVLWSQWNYESLDKICIEAWFYFDDIYAKIKDYFLFLSAILICVPLVRTTASTTKIPRQLLIMGIDLSPKFSNGKTTEIRYSPIHKLYFK